MTMEYAVKIDKSNPYLKDTDAVQYLAVDTDPAVPYRKIKRSPALHPAALAPAVPVLVKRDGDGEWEPVNGIDLHCIGLRAKHEIILKRAMVKGYGWARCTCGWQDDLSYQGGYAAPNYEASAEQHMADVDARINRFRDMLRYVRHTPEQEACPHLRDETRDSLNPGIKEWRCRDCGLHIQWAIDVTRM